MEGLKKFLRKLPANDRDRVELVIGKILSNDFATLDVKLLRGRNEFFRARVGNYRIIYRFTKGETGILDISHRSEKTYRDI